MKIHFFIKYHTKFGESLWISGNARELGASNQSGMAAMHYLSDDYWKLEIDIDVVNLTDGLLQYKYYLQSDSGELLSEYKDDRCVNILHTSVSVLKLYDVWNFSGDIGNVFFTAPFSNVLLPATPSITVGKVEVITHTFKVKAPLLQPNEAICLTGDGSVMNNWDMYRPIIMTKEGDWWTIGLNLHDAVFPIAYKYGIYDIEKNVFVRLENGSNRICFEPVAEDEQIILHDGFFNQPTDTWKGAGVAIPVFSLRTYNGLGVGEFNDLKLLADWAEKTGLKLIQLLPINDTTATYTCMDSYPYAAISAFALHPLFLNIDSVAGNKYGELLQEIHLKKIELNALGDIDYVEVMKIKMAALQQIFHKEIPDIYTQPAYKKFLTENEKWLMPYASFCYLRDRYKTADASQWKTHSRYSEKEIKKFFTPSAAAYSKVTFYCWLQYHLHLQLESAVDYAHKKGIVLKGDVPIGVYRYGCDAWMAPQLYKMDMQAGAPPDDFAATGQNWGFPTYNWQRMHQDGFAWWRQRFEQMSLYFDAFRIDHILGFFRIWSIPIHAIQGVMGRFDACLPVHKNEFGENGIWFDEKRYCHPYITDKVLDEVFGDEAEKIKKDFLTRNGPDTYEMLPVFNTQRKIEDWFTQAKHTIENERIKNGLHSLMSNFILFQQEQSDGTLFHFRIGMEKTLSFKYLPNEAKERLVHLYIDYFFKRQNDFWRVEGLKKLPSLKEATNMLVCGEDLGMVPDSVPQVMKQLGILSLEIQRMPKKPGAEFFNPGEAPYLSIVTPSTHDMSTIRGWWQENRDVTQRFYNSQLGQSGEAPFYCEAWINRAIILQHLYAPAMWSIFQIQDLLGMSENLRRQMPEEERINIPADPKHYWRYRMHIPIEQLLREEKFNNELQGFIRNSGR